MKKIIYLALPLIAILLLSCSSDDVSEIIDNTTEISDTDTGEDDDSDTGDDLDTGDDDDPDTGNDDDSDTGDDNDPDTGDDDDSDTGDDDDPDILDPIIGTWRLASAVTIDNGQTPVQLTECQMQSNFEFSEAQTFTFTPFTGSSNCSLGNPLTSTWQNNGNGKYTLDVSPLIISGQMVTLENDALTVSFRRFEANGDGRIGSTFEERQVYIKIP